MNTDKAYILGLVIGGGVFSSDLSKLTIRLPYKQWGSVSTNPKRAGEIGNDIIHVVAPMIKSEYDLSVVYTTSERVWSIECNGDTTDVVNDLRKYGINPEKIEQHQEDMSKLIAAFVDDNMKRRFIAGLADTIGSLAPSQRRFSDNVQIISFEISGFAFKFVCQLCNLLYSVGCIPDQILWQHPNLQSGENAYYRSWKKGNKLRVTLDAFSEFGALAFKSKAVAASENLKKQKDTNDAIECESKGMVIAGITAKHIDEDYPALPDEIRGGHFLHSKHICAALDCPHAPYKDVECSLNCAAEHISPFTVLSKGSRIEIADIVKNEPIMSNRTYKSVDIKVSELMEAVEKKATMLTFIHGYPNYKENADTGYPINVFVRGVTFILASRTGLLNGNRPRGTQDSIINAALKKDPNCSVTVKVPDLLTPLIITEGDYAALVGPCNPKVYKKLLSRDPKNKYKLMIRDITESDLI